MDKGGRRGPSHWTNPPSIPWTAAASTVPDDLASGSLQSVARVRPLGRQRKHLNLQPGQAKGGGRRRQCLWFRSHVDRLFEAQAAPAMAARGKPRVADAGLAELAGLPALPTGMVLRATCPPRPRSRCKQQQSPTVTGMIVVAKQADPCDPTLEPRRRPGWPPNSRAIPAAGSGWTAATPATCNNQFRRGRCWTAPPARRRVLALASEHHCSQRLAADSQAAATARQLAAEAVTAAGLHGVLADVEQLIGELVANAARRTEAPLELTIDAHDDVVRVEVHDQAPRVALGLEEHPAVRSGALGPVATDSSHPWRAERPGGGHKVVWAELHAGDGG
jgi:hypothetical protein